MARRPVFAMELLEMRRFGDRRPRLNTVVITDDRNVARVCREKLAIFVLLVEPFLPYDLGLCFDLHVWVVMQGATDRIRAALRRAGARSACIDEEATAFWIWVEWLNEKRAGRTQLRCYEWLRTRRVAEAQLGAA